MIRINKVFLSFIYLGILLLPITSLDIPLLEKVFRGVAEEASFYPIFLGTVLWLFSLLIKKGEIFIPKCLCFYLLLLFLALTVISGIMNVENILQNNLRGVYGLQRYISLLFGIASNIIFIVFIFNVTIKKKIF